MQCLRQVVNLRHRLADPTRQCSALPGIGPVIGCLGAHSAGGKRRPMNRVGVWMLSSPSGVTYQRNANFATQTLLNTNNITPVAVSIDPFFFSIAPTPRG